MSGFSLLDVALAMVFFFLLLSLICSAANELIAAVLQMRARSLERGIARLLETPEFAQEFYNHPLIRNLSDEANPLLSRLGRRGLPSYIPARAFALAIMDLIQPGFGTRDALPAGLPASAPLPNEVGMLAALGGAAIPAGVKSALRSLILAGGADAAKTRENLEGWYNDAMDRVSGGYKRRTQYVLFVLGLIATLSVNADTVMVAERLATSKVLSGAVSQAAEQFTARKDGNANGDRAGDNDRIERAERQLGSTLDTLDKLELPVGWTGPGPQNLLRLPGETFPSSLARLLSTHWIGWLISALAISLGAPFWFDVLNRFMVVRSTVKPKEKSQPEASKD